MEEAKSGDTVRVHYTGKLDDETTFQTSIGRDPLEFTIGEERIIPALENAVIGMKPGDAKTVKISAEDAFGPYHEDLVRTIERSEFATDLQPKVGQRLNLSEPSGHEIAVTVTDFSEASVTLDANHPLAGEDLVFDIELVEIV
ncbi:MAG TPA: peptidylprolyl isomerase [Sedimentisphaerales bacterium]|nr:peptidylprolyl isomerase [Sedimentisphaerales bacterium]